MKLSGDISFVNDNGAQRLVSLSCRSVLSLGRCVFSLKQAACKGAMSIFDMNNRAGGKQLQLSTSRVGERPLLLLAESHQRERRRAGNAG